ncbi:cache domain-containing protein [Geobacter anodireducens]
MKSLLAIRTKIFLAILLILLVSYSFLVVITIRTIDSSLEGELSRKLAEQVRYAKDQYTNRAEQIQYSLMHPASAPPVRERMAARDTPWLRDAARRWMTILPFVELIVFVDSRGTVIAGGNQYRRDRTFELTPVVERALRERRPLVSTELVTADFLCGEGLVNYCRGGGAGKTGEVMMLTVVVPVMDAKGAMVGAFVAGDIIETDTGIPSQVQEVFGRQVYVAITHKEIIPPDSFGKSGSQPIPARILEGLRQGFPFRAMRRSAARSTPRPLIPSPTAGAISSVPWPWRFPVKTSKEPCRGAWATSWPRRSWASCCPLSLPTGCRSG